MIAQPASHDKAAENVGTRRHKSAAKPWLCAQIGLAQALLPRSLMLQRALLLVAAVALSACQGSITGNNASGGEGGANENGGEGGAGASGANTGTGGVGATGGSGGSGATGGSGGSAPCTPPDGAGTFEVGTGEKCFTALNEGDALPLVNGPQGGYHVWFAVGCMDCTDPVHLKYGVWNAQTKMPLEGTGNFESMVPLGSETWPQAAGIIVYMPGLAWDPENDPPPAKGTPVILWSDAYTASDKVLHHDEVALVIGDTVYWDPCSETPDDPNCAFDGGP